MKFNLVESSLGTKTTEGMARKIDELLPTIPSELRTVKKKFSSETKAEGERSDISVITTSDPDRDQEIVVADGLLLDDYRANPVVLFSHDQCRPCGTCQWIKPKDQKLVARTLYPKRPAEYEGEWLADYVHALVVADVLKGKSIGFLPLEIRDPDEEELAKYPNLQRVITSGLLVEYSCVSVPANPKALVEAINKGLTSLERMGIPVIGKVTRRKPKAKPFDPQEIADAVYKKLMSKWEV